MPFDLLEHLKWLSAIAAPAGHEGPLRDALRDAWARLVDEFHTDGLGSLIAIRHGTGPAPRRTVMLSAHMDEIGLIVAEVRNGFIRTSPLGTVDYRVLLQQPVLVHGRRTLPGLFGAAPPHMARDRGKYPSAEELWVDVGLPADEVAALVRVGDVITLDAPPVELKGERLAARALDNRASLAAVTLCLDELTRRTHAWDVAAVASAQEEVGSRGAITATHQIAPDIAIALDVTFGVQKGVGEEEGYALGSGPTIGRGPNFHPRLVEAFQATAQALEIKLPIEPVPGDSSTEAWLIQVSRSGIPTLLLGIPLRNMHTPAEIVDLRDVTRAGRLLAAFIAGLQPDFLAEIAWTVPDQTGRKDGDV